MDVPIDKPKDADGAPQSSVSGVDSPTRKIREFLAAKVLSLSIFVVGILAWIFQSYGLPATQSIWKEMLLPRIHNFIIEEAKTPEFHDLMVKTINNYLSGDLPTTERPNDAGIRLRKLAQGSDRIDAISTSLFGGVDSVYTISNEYNLEQLKDITKNVLTIQTEPSIDPIRLFIYADPKQHCVWAYVKPFGDIVALAPAGFPASERKPINLGLLKTDDITLSQLLNDGPSAVLCLDSPKYMNKGYQFQLPVFYRPDESSQQELISKCRDAVQVGPRILEDPNSLAKANSTLLTYKRTKKNGDLDPQPVYLGIQAKFASRSTPYFRTVFALDEPGRDDPDEKSRKVARNAYIIVTETPVTLWELQNLLTSPAFYANDQYAPYWAVNLVGGDYAGLVLKLPGGDAKPLGIGNTVITQASILAVVPRN